MIGMTEGDANDAEGKRHEGTKGLWEREERDRPPLSLRERAGVRASYERCIAGAVPFVQNMGEKSY
jgi:hypothetical protein